MIKVIVSVVLVPVFVVVVKVIVVVVLEALSVVLEVFSVEVLAEFTFSIYSIKLLVTAEVFLG